LSRAAVLTVGTGLVAVVVYLAQFSLGLALAGKPYGFESSMAVTWDLYQHHARLTDWKNPLTSRWYSWFIPQKPIMMYREPDGPYWRVMSSLGNLRSEEHTSELQSRENLVCRLLLEKKNQRR